MIYIINFSAMIVIIFGLILVIQVITYYNKKK